MEIIIVLTNHPRIESIMKEFFEVKRYYRSISKNVSHIYSDYIISQGSKLCKRIWYYVCIAIKIMSLSITLALILQQMKMCKNCRRK